MRANILSQPITHHTLTSRNKHIASTKTSQRFSSTQNLVSTKLTQLRTLSEKAIQVCYKCGDQGHQTYSYRNALICFKCKKTGHQASTCRPMNPPIKQYPSEIVTLISSQITIVTHNTPLPITYFSSYLFAPFHHVSLVDPDGRVPPRGKHSPSNEILCNSRHYLIMYFSLQGVVHTDARGLGAHYIQSHLH